jgi:hypothetical protein
MDYKNNADILSWKRVIQNLQDRTNEGVKEYNEAQEKVTEAVGEFAEPLYTLQDELGLEDNILVDELARWMSGQDIADFVADFRSDHDMNENVKEEKVTEGTWSIPDTPEKVRELKDLMKQELPADEAQDKIYGILGDDELFDDIAEMEEKDPKADVRGMIVRRLDDLGLIKKKVNETTEALTEEQFDETTINYVDDYDTITKIDIEKDGIMYNGSDIKVYDWDGPAKAVLTPEMHSRAKDWDEVHQYLVRFLGNPKGLQAAARNVFAMNDEEVTVNESLMISESKFDEAAGEKDACYHKVKARYKIWPSAYASGALTQCRKKGAKNWGNSKK